MDNNPLSSDGKRVFVEGLLKDAPTFTGFLKENNLQFSDFVKNFKQNLGKLQKIEDPVKNLLCNYEFITLVSRTSLSPSVKTLVLQVKEILDRLKMSLENISQMPLSEWPAVDVFAPRVPLVDLENQNELQIDNPLVSERFALCMRIEGLETDNNRMLRQIEENNQTIQFLSAKVLALKKEAEKKLKKAHQG